MPESVTVMSEFYGEFDLSSDERLLLDAHGGDGGTFLLPFLLPPLNSSSLLSGFGFYFG